MSGYGDDRRREHRSGETPGRRRSISPRDDRREGSGDRGGYGGSRGGRGGRGGRGDFGGSRGGGRGGARGGDYDVDRGSSDSFRSSLPDLPSVAAIPGTGRRFEPPGHIPQGTAGQKTMILVNHYEIQSLPMVKVYQYDLRMRVPESSQRRGSEAVTANQIARVMQQAVVKKYLGDHFVFDGVSLGWSAKSLMPVGSTNSALIDLPGHKAEKPNQVELMLRCSGILSIVALVDYIRKQQITLDPMGNKAIEPLLKWLNAVYREDPAARWVSRPNCSAYYHRTTQTMQPLRSTGGVLEALRGVYQTVQLRFGRLTINVDTATTAFWTPDKCLIELLHAVSGVPLSSSIETSFLDDPGRFFDACTRLVGMYFQVKHLNSVRNNRRVKLQKWSLKDAFGTQFEKEDRATGTKTMTNVNDYFRDTYQKELKYPRLPLADTRDGQFPLEMCFSAPGERFKDPLQGAETADFIKFATAPAYVRAQQITENVKKLHWHELSTPPTMGLSVKPQMLKIEGRILPSPTPQYSSGTDSRAPESGRWNLRGKRLLQGATINSWGFLYFPAFIRPIDLAVLENFMNASRMSFNQMGIRVPRDLPAFLQGNVQGDVKVMIAEVMAKAKDTFGTKPDVVFFLLHAASTALYKAIKDCCDVQFGIASQVMLVDKAMNQRGQQQYLGNIGLKVNVKLGGLNSKIIEPAFKARRFMIMGGDTSHPSPSQMRMNPPPPAYTALTASWDKDCTQYTSVVSAQAATNQLIDDFVAMVKELVKRYREKNQGAIPDSIIYYRDGLSEGQFQQIIETEGKPLKKICSAFGAKAPKITIIVCVKRHHTRMFPTEAGDKNGNVLPGTVVENRKGNDIYLVAHPGLQGTNRPTRYASLVDENNLSPNDFQRLTNNLCWTYARATCAVSIVPPVYYADQACERAKLHVREQEDGSQILGQVHEDLKYAMYWQ